MFNKNKKGFTTVELVIVIAIIAILASVLVPTFASLIDKANESADIQAVRQMNIALAVESIENKPDTVGEVITILSEAGYNSTDKLVPVSAKHGFYWCKAANMITLIKDEGDELPKLIFPTEEAALNTAFTEAAANWAAAITGDDAVFFDLEPAAINKGLPGGENAGGGNEGGGNAGGNGGAETPEGTPINNAADLADALAAGGTYYLTEGIEITTALTIPEGITVNLDLNGKTLTINDPSTDDEACYPITVQGTLEIADDSTNNIENAGTIIISEANENNFVAYNMYCGIYVDGELNLDGVNITGNRKCNIENYGTTNLNNVQYTVNCGTGFYTASADTIDAETSETVASVTISNSAFIATGAVTPIRGESDSSGSMKISGTVFSKATDSVTYPDSVIAWSSDGDLTLTDVTVEASEMNVSSQKAKLTVNGGDFGGALSGNPLVITADEDDEFDGEIFFNGSGNSINAGTFKGQLNFREDSETTITGGTFEGGLYCLRVNNVIIDGGTFSGTLHFHHESIVTINGGTFNSQLKCVAETSGGNTITITNEKEPEFFNGTKLVSYNEISEAILAEGSDCVLSGNAGSGWIISKPDN